MNLETFYKHFDLLADAPNAVQKLRKLILRLAVQGKLVEQDPLDEPATAILDSIGCSNNSRQVKDSAKRALELPSISGGEKPFAIPDSWEWVRFGAIVDFRPGKTPSRKDSRFWADGAYPWVSISDMTHGETIVETKEKVSQLAAQDVFRGAISPKGTLLMSFKLTIGKMSILGTDAFHNEAIISIHPLHHALQDYLFKCLNSFDLAIGNKAAIKGKTLNRDSLSMIVLAIPPEREIQRILGKVDELMVLCDDLEAKQEVRNRARLTLNTAALRELQATGDSSAFKRSWRRVSSNFDLLYSTPENITELRKAILQLAVQGKLVEQGVFEAHREEVPLEAILREGSRNGLSTRPSESPPGVPILRISAATSRSDAIVDESDYKFLEVNTYDIDKYSLQAGDLLACRFNGNLHFVGRFALYLNLSEELRIYPDKLIRFRVDQERAHPKYVCLAMNSSASRMKIEKFCATTAGNIGISASNLKTVTLTLPLLSVQKRIVAKVDELMALVDQLEEGLVQAREDAERLLEAVVQHLLDAPAKGAYGKSERDAVTVASS